MFNVIVENSRFSPASVSDASTWQSQFGLDTFTVLADTNEDWISQYEDPDAFLFAQHSYTVVGSDGRVQWHQFEHDGSTLDDITAAAEAAE